jgi:hypothetical protein
MVRPHALLAVTFFVLSLAAASGCHEDTSTAPHAAPWVKYPANPVLEAGPPGSWDELGVGSPCVIRSGAHSYIMWYAGTGAAGMQIGIATSSDGITWEKDARNPIFGLGNTGEWDADGIGDPCVFLEGTHYVMYYSGGQAPRRMIGCATSDDGFIWYRAAAVAVLGPAAGPAWDDREVMTPWVIPAGNSYTMWYGALGSNGFRATGRATSMDGINWSRALSPVLDPQVLEAVCIGPCVLAGGGVYRLWCVAWHETTGGHAYPAVIDFAHSVDGVDWTRNKLALSPGASTAWDGGELRAVCVRDEGLVMKMWYQGQAAGFPSAIGLATQP